MLHLMHLHIDLQMILIPINGFLTLNKIYWKACIERNKPTALAETSPIQMP